jgi:hypothetical protein
MSQNSQSLLVPHRKELFEEFLSECGVEDFDTAISLFSERDLYVYNLVLRRIKLTENLRQEDVFTYVNKGVGLFEEAALRLHLFLGCIEVIAGLSDDSCFLDYSSWLAAKKAPYRNEKSNIDIPADATPEQVASLYHKEYLKIHGVRTHFYRFFHDCLTAEDRRELLDVCWVLKQRPLPFTGDLQWIEAGKEYGVDDATKAAKGREVWESLDEHTKITRISEALYSIRNLYTHSLVPYTSVQDKTSPIPPEGNPRSFVNRGDTVFVWERGIAISFALRPTSEYVRDLIKLGLKNHFGSHYGNG